MLGFAAQKDAALNGEGFDAITGRTIRHDSGLKRWARGLKQTLKINTFNAVLFLGSVCLSILGIVASIKLLVQTFANNPAITSFTCVSPVLWELWEPTPKTCIGDFKDWGVARVLTGRTKCRPKDGHEDKFKIILLISSIYLALYGFHLSPLYLSFNLNASQSVTDVILDKCLFNWKLRQSLIAVQLIVPQQHKMVIVEFTPQSLIGE